MVAPLEARAGVVRARIPWRRRQWPAMDTELHLFSARPDAHTPVRRVALLPDTTREVAELAFEPEHGDGECVTPFLERPHAIVVRAVRRFLVPLPHIPALLPAIPTCYLPYPLCHLPYPHTLPLAQIRALLLAIRDQVGHVRCARRCPRHLVPLLAPGGMPPSVWSPRRPSRHPPRRPRHTHIRPGASLTRERRPLH